MKRMTRSLTMLVAAMICACGGGGGNTAAAGSCSESSGGAVVTCTQYGEGYTASEVMMACTGSGVTYSADPCPTANRVGHCDVSLTSGGHTASETVSEYPPATTALAMSTCNAENGGGGMTAVFTAN